jgi:lipid-A-disaccharide synthase
LAGKVKATLPRDVVRARLAAEAGFEQDKTPLIGLLPGSRANEIKRLLPVILDAAERLMDTHPTARFLLFQAASLPPDTITEALAARRLPVQVIQGQDYDLLQCADAVITVSGTATLEVALLGVPMAIVYRLAPLSYWLGRLLVKVPFIGLPNILAGRRLVREFIQHEATADNLAQEMSRILDHPAVADTIKQGLAEIRGVLGDRDGSFELALLARDMLLSNAQRDPD